MMRNYISTDKKFVDIGFVHEFVRNSHWGAGRTEEKTRKTVTSSLFYGMYAKIDKQIRFARVVTDYVFFGYIMDVIIAFEYQGKGLGKVLVNYILEHG